MLVCVCLGFVWASQTAGLNQGMNVCTILGLNRPDVAVSHVQKLRVVRPSEHKLDKVQGLPVTWRIHGCVQFPLLLPASAVNSCMRTPWLSCGLLMITMEDRCQ